MKISDRAELASLRNQAERQADRHDAHGHLAAARMWAELAAFAHLALRSGGQLRVTLLDYKNSIIKVGEQHEQPPTPLEDNEL